MSKPKRVRIVFDADQDYRTNLKILSAQLGKSIAQIIFESLQKTHGLQPPKPTHKSPQARNDAALRDFSFTQLRRWKKEAVKRLPQLFSNQEKKIEAIKAEYEKQVQELYAEVGRLTTQLSWLKKNLVSDLTRAERAASGTKKYISKNTPAPGKPVGG